MLVEGGKVTGENSSDDIVTENHYDPVGNLDLVRLPNCVAQGSGCALSVDYGYDGVDRLTTIEDPLENKVKYTYDTEGNRTKEENLDAEDGVRRLTAFVYDKYKLLTKACPGGLSGSLCTTYEYYEDGKFANQDDPEGHRSGMQYNRLRLPKYAIQVASGGNLVTYFTFDNQNNVKTVTDPKGFVTAYTNNDLGWVYKVLSPFSSSASTTTLHDYDPAGNVKWTKDNANVEVARTYDALNRLLTINYPGTDQDVTLSYDSDAVSFGIGRRTGMVDASGETTYHYDPRGLLTKEEKQIGATVFTTEYEYDKTGNLTHVRYPTESPLKRQGEVEFVYDAADRVSSVNASVNGAPVDVATEMAYEPFGPRTLMTLGNDLVDTRSYDERYQLDDWIVEGEDPLLSYGYTRNLDGNVTALADALPANDRTFGYDAFHRLTHATGPWCTGSQCTPITCTETSSCKGGSSPNYTYDKNGNRCCNGEGNPKTDYVYLSASNALDYSTTSNQTKDYDYDQNRNTSDDDTHTYEYGANNRLVAVDSGSTATYVYDGDWRRAIKVADGVTTYFFYNPDGILLTEMVLATGSGKDYVYVNGAPVARVDWTEHNLGTVLTMDESSPDVLADWSGYSSGSYEYLVRRKLADPDDRTFDGSEVIAAVSDPTRAYDDPVFDDDYDYDYVVVRKSEDLYFYHTDHLGTPIAMTGTAGSLMWQAEYRPWGDVESFSTCSRSLPGVPCIENNLRFPGQYYDAETKLHQNYFRDYDPKIGRYREPDPIGLGGGTNLFAYVENNPENLVDPLGLEVWVCNRGAKGIPGNHSYFWDDTTAGCCGMGSTKECSEKGPTRRTSTGALVLGDDCFKVDGSRDHEAQLMQCCRRTADRGLWFPVVNDCHEALDDCLRKCGIANPGAPGGRLGKPCDPCGEGQ